MVASTLKNKSQIMTKSLKKSVKSGKMNQIDFLMKTITVR